MFIYVTIKALEINSYIAYNYPQQNKRYIPASKKTICMF